MKKTPIGIIPKKNFLANRLYDLRRAMNEYNQECLPIHVEWVEEYNEIVEYLFPDNPIAKMKKVFPNLEV